MDTFFNDLRNQPTLAPVRLQEEFYSPTNINKRDAGILATISKTSITTIEQTIGTLSHLLQNLKTYKECIIQSINTQAETADLSTKYSRDIPKQSYTLPGIMTSGESYDMEDITKDNARMMALNDERDKVLKQKDIYLRLSQEDVRLFIAAWKRLLLNNHSFDAFVESLNQSLNKNY